MPLPRDKEVEQQFDHLYQAGSFAEALDLATREAHIFPEHAQKVVYFWRINCAGKLNDGELTLHLLNKAVQAGYWYYHLLEDDDFAFLRGDAEFIRLAGICDARRAEAIAKAIPVIKTLAPDGKAGPYPLLLALHGGGGVAQPEHWMAAVKQGWFLGMPQSSQLHGPGTYTWNDWDWALQEVTQRFVEILSAHPIDKDQVVLAGFSQGRRFGSLAGIERSDPGVRPDPGQPIPC